MCNCNHEHDHSHDIDQGWEELRQNEVIAGLKEGKKLSDILEAMPGFREAFRELDTIDCSDGRVLGGAKIGIAGSGMLLPSEERAKFIAAYKGKIKKVTAHHDCGAARIKYNSLDEKLGTDSDDYGKLYCQKLADDLGAEYDFVDEAHLDNEYHNEVVIVLDQTAQFDSTNFEGFPPHFVCTGAGLGFSDDYMTIELKTLAGIAAGDHGFGERFTEDNPLHVIVAADDKDQLQRWQMVAKAALENMGAKIDVTGFVKP